MRPHRLDDGGLAAADIGEDGARLQRPGDRCRDLAHRADGRAQDDEVGIRDRVACCLRDAVDEIDLHRPCTHVRVGVGTNHHAREVLLARHAAQRGADQAEADDGKGVEQRRRERRPELVSQGTTPCRSLPSNDTS
jgi:hypothetical protein